MWSRPSHARAGGHLVVHGMRLSCTSVPRPKHSGILDPRAKPEDDSILGFFAVPQDKHPGTLVYAPLPSHPAIYSRDPGPNNEVFAVSFRIQDLTSQYRTDVASARRRRLAVAKRRRIDGPG